ncbi:hypothetical protein NC651_005099 [Populus alba x Populus x berolinensis]|nr:hypothetical protein NC651_005099 [Populus alba x Populus x berolinensis]
MQSLRREKVFCVFKLNTGQDDHAIMFSDDHSTEVGCLYFGRSFSTFIVGNGCA